MRSAVDCRSPPEIGHTAARRGTVPSADVHPPGDRGLKNFEDNSDRELYTIAIFCRRYCVGKTRTYELINAGRVKAVKLGARTLIPRASAEAWARSLPAFEPRSTSRGHRSTSETTCGGADYASDDLRYDRSRPDAGQRRACRHVARGDPSYRQEA
jgi:hypothetical protein